MTRIVVAGALGRMGRAILNAALKDDSIRVAGGTEAPDHPDLGKDLGTLLGGKPLGVTLSAELAPLLRSADALIDFTFPALMPSHLQAAEAAATGYVLGTTGLTEDHRKELARAAQKIALVQSPNMSVGVNLLFKLVEMAGHILDESYDAEILEIHHRHKKDSPSGTALKILEILADIRKRDLRNDVVYGRQGETGARPRGEIGVLALRGGDVVGEHTVSFLGEGERIELIHKASSREAFALGALRAAKFVASRKPGLYNMQNVLGI